MGSSRLLHILRRAAFSETPPPLWGRPVCEADREGGAFRNSATPLPNPPPQGGREQTTRAVFQFTALLSAALMCCVGSSTRAEVQKLLHPCGGLQLCASYQLVLTPPDGWVVDEKASNDNRVQIMVPKGQSFATAEPLIYIQV